jgi:hypothetical protein
MSCSEEEWKPVVGCENWYEVSSYGRVRRVKCSTCGNPGSILKHYYSDPGYARVTLPVKGKCRRSFYVHHIVAKAFLGPRPKGMTINHIDGDKQNPAVSNLEYITKSEDIAHAYRLGLRRRGEHHPHAKLTEEEARQIRQLCGKMTQQRVANKFGVSPTVVRAIWIGKTWKHQS